MSQKNPNVQRTVVVLLCLIVMIVGIMVSRVMRTPESTLSPVNAENQRSEVLLKAGAFVRPQPRALGVFELTDQQGQAFGNRRFVGQWSLVFLGYTHCPDVCPTTLALFKQLHSSWQETSLANIQYVLLSADPERDTPQQLAAYLDYFHKDFVGLTGTVAEVDRLAKQLSSLFARVPQEGGDYLVDHSANIIIINPAGQYHGFIRQPHSLEQIKTVMQSITAMY